MVKTSSRLLIDFGFVAAENANKRKFQKRCFGVWKKIGVQDVLEPRKRLLKIKDCALFLGLVAGPKKKGKLEATLNQLKPIRIQICAYPRHLSLAWPPTSATILLSLSDSIFGRPRSAIRLKTAT